MTISGGNLLSGLNDREMMARLELRRQLVERLAVQMGVSPARAREALCQFEAASSAGQTVQ